MYCLFIIIIFTCHFRITRVRILSHPFIPFRYEASRIGGSWPGRQLTAHRGVHPPVQVDWPIN